MFIELFLEYVAEASGIVVSAINAIEMDAIKCNTVRVSIQIVLETIRKRMVGNNYFVFNITMFKSIMKSFIAKLGDLVLHSKRVK